MMADFLLVESILVHVEVEQGNGIDMIEFEIPFIPLGCLFANRESRVEKGAILEIRLVGILHFYDELLAVFALAIYIKDGSAAVVTGLVIFLLILGLWKAWGKGGAE